MTTILAIEDESQNLKLLQKYLIDTSYTLLTAGNGAEGWEVLTQHRDVIKVILLDRMMPVMDGMEFLMKLKQEKPFPHTPVIMQTAASAPEQIAEGIQAGVFYYLTKPYDEEVLLSIIQAALQDSATQNALLLEVQKNKHFLGLIEQCNISCQTLNEARDLAGFLASCFPEPDRVALGISELLINAIEHGNLNVTYTEKSALTKLDKWEEEIQRRLALAENADKRVRVHYEKDVTECRLTITDEGQGFDWRGYLTIDPDRATDTHGRGIAMSRIISFDELYYSDKGNQVTAVVRLPGG